MVPMLSSNASRGLILKLGLPWIQKHGKPPISWLVLGGMVEAVLGATGVVVVLPTVAVVVLGMLIGEGSRIGELR